MESDPIGLMGMAVILLEQHYQFQANSVRNKKVLSVIFIGLQVVQDTRIRLSKADIESAWKQLMVLQKDHE